MGDVTTIDVGSGFFVVQFTHKEDYNAALTGGPWLLYDHYLAVQPSKQVFDPEGEEINKIAAWIRISKLSLDFYDTGILHVLGSQVGRVLKVDKTTLGRKKGRFARICVELDLSAPLCPMILVNGREYKVQYESIHLICFTCGRYGHDADHCTSGNIGGSNVKTTSGDAAELNKQNDGTMGEGEEGKNKMEKETPAVTPFESWMVVQRTRRFRRLNQIVDKGSDSGREIRGTQIMGSRGSRFSALSEGDFQGEEGGATNQEKISTQDMNKKGASYSLYNPLGVGPSTMKKNGPHPKKIINGPEKSSKGKGVTQMPATLGASDMAILIKVKAGLGPHMNEPSLVNQKDLVLAEGKRITSYVHPSQPPDMHLEHVQKCDPLSGSTTGCEVADNPHDPGETSTEDGVDFNVTYKSSQVLHGRFYGSTHAAWDLSVIYGHPNVSQRHHLWQQLREIEERGVTRWCIGGDFNATLRNNDRRSHARVPVGPDREFSRWVRESGVTEVEFQGPQFTWSRGTCSSRLDRIVASEGWRNKFNEALCLHLPKVVKDTWSSTREWGQNVENFKKRVVVWNKEVFGNIDRRKSTLLSRLEYLAKTSGDDPSWNSERNRVWEELEQCLVQEELMWLQRSRVNWYSQGDRNTSYFHNVTKSRSRRKTIEALRTEEGEWCYDPEELKRAGTAFFQSLYSAKQDCSELIDFGSTYPQIPSDRLDFLGGNISSEEVKKAIFSMGALKAPGPNGLNPLFFQSQWHIVGESIIKLTQKFFSNPSEIEGVNGTNIVLIPKVETPQTFRDLRPISLCNVIYKVFTKTLANRLKTIMPLLVAPNQCSFVPGRQIQDNIILVQEIVHSMSRMKRRKGFMALKIDLEKAYDRVHWNFVIRCPKEFGAPANFTNVILAALKTARIQVQWNGAKGSVFAPTRGLRQGDPISPYLFVLIMEKLAHLIQNEQAWNKRALSRPA
ncbi:uncharacterized protein LOC114720467 [Neltuma alba]|uniref:uncharacterized protein LOC114720467 n=1 Tax=Neltuma alba TaxID=207710 RepID=UPI0010A2EB9C|nr:uncharacterized protein LOC114720467 [Prosopis alba]